MNRPFFSIILPTKGRDKLISKTINSIIEQSCDDYEILIIDNNIDNLTKQVISKYDDPRIRYYKTGGLNMPDNWEYGFSKAVGKYFTVLSDRMYYSSKFSLNIIQEILITHKTNIVTWKWTSEDGFKSGNQKKTILKNNIYNFSSRDVLQGFLDGGKQRHWFNIASPKGLNSCISRELYESVITKFDRLFYPISPDFTSAFILLFMEKEIIHINGNIVISGGLSVSNGLNNIKDKRKNIEYIQEVTNNLNSSFKYTPIPVISVFNSMYNDLFYISEKVRWNLSWDMVNKIEYYILIYNEIKNNLYKEDKKTDLKKWRNALNHEKPSIRKSVIRKIKEMEKHVYKNLLKKKIRLIYKYKLLPFLKGFH